LDQIGQSHHDLSVEDTFHVPAWFFDQRSWIQDPCKSNSAAYNLPMCLRIRGQLKCESVISAVQQVQQRQQVLRSTFRIVNDQLTQIVSPPRPIAAQLTDLSGLGTEHAESRWRDLALEEAVRPFDLAREPGLRLHIVKLAADIHILLLTSHHLVCDDWSTGILLGEIFKLYRATSAGQSNPLQEMPGFQYGDFIRWHHDQLKRGGLATRLSFWKEQLADRSDFHHLKLDHLRPPHRTYCGAIETEILPDTLTNSLKGLSRKERVSLFMTMLAAFQCLLHRESGHDDIAVGSCAANRLLTEVEPLVGRFANDLVVRTSFSANPTFRELLGRVRKEALNAYSYQDLPFARLLEEIEPRPDPSRNPLFQIMFVLQDAPKEELQVPGMALEWMPLDTKTAKFDLSVWLSFQPQPRVSLEYNTDLFDPGTIRQILEQYRKILESMVRDPEERVGDASIARTRPTSKDESAAANPQVSMLQGNTVELELLKIWQKGFWKQPIDVRDDFFQSGGSSLLAAHLFAQIEKIFNLKFPLVTLIEAPTIEKLAKVIRKSGSQDMGDSVVPIQPRGSRPPLFCAHGQSGNLLIYRSLAQHIGPDQPVYGLQPQGLDGRGSPLTRIEDMACKYVKEIQDVQRSGPYFLAGYCMGGAIALEMAQQLREKGETIGLLALLDTYNMYKMRPTWLGSVRFKIETWWFGWQHFWRAGSQNKMSFLRRRLMDLRDGDSELEKCNERAALSYVPKAYGGKLLHVRPTRQWTRYTSPELGWDNLATGGVETFSLPMYPGQMFEEPFVRYLANKLRAGMDEIAAEKKSPTS
jgi:pimeloyl-ACP methyl ester carboxylesterase